MGKVCNQPECLLVPLFEEKVLHRLHGLNDQVVGWDQVPAHSEPGGASDTRHRLR